MKINHTDTSELFSAIIHEIKNSLNPVINLSALMLRNSGSRLNEDENTWLEAIGRNGNRILNLVEEFSFLKKLPKNYDTKSSSRISIHETLETAYNTTRGLHAPSDSKLVSLDDDFSVLIDKEILLRILENVFHYFLISDSNRDIYAKSSMSGAIINIIISRKKDVILNEDKSAAGNDTLPETGFSATRIIWLQFAMLYINSLRGIDSFSHDNEGDAVFSFSIPTGGVDEVNSKVVEDGERASHRKKVREFVMLIIDDDIDNITPVNAIVENEFNGTATVYHAENGGKGLDLLETIKPDIILLDLTLPDISGLSLVRNIKHLFLRNNIPVIAFTALDIANDRERLYKSGFDDVIKKPFSIETFIQIITKWVGI